MWLKLDTTYKLGYMVVSSVPRHFNMNDNLFLGIDGGLYFYVHGDDVRYDYINGAIEKIGDTNFYYYCEGPRTMLKNIGNVYFYTEYRYHGEKYSKIGSSYLYYDIEHKDRVSKIGDHNIYYDYNNRVNQIDSNYIYDNGYSY